MQKGCWGDEGNKNALSCPGSSIHIGWLLRLETLQAFDQLEERTKRQNNKKKVTTKQTKRQGVIKLNTTSRILSVRRVPPSPPHYGHFLKKFCSTMPKNCVFCPKKTRQARLLFEYVSDSVFVRLKENINKYWDGNTVYKKHVFWSKKLRIWVEKELRIGGYLYRQNLQSSIWRHPSRKYSKKS